MGLGLRIRWPMLLAWLCFVALLFGPLVDALPLEAAIVTALTVLPQEAPELAYGLLPIEGYDAHPTAGQSNDDDRLWDIPIPQTKAVITGLFATSAEFFSFTEANIGASLVQKWYSNWTIEAQNEPDWDDIGEQRLFGRVFLNSNSFECGLGFSGCKGMVSLMELLHTYPGDLETVRRVYFAQFMYSYYHDFVKTLENGALMGQQAGASLIPSVVKRFTHQADASADAICRIRRFFFKMAVDAAVNAAFAAISAATSVHIPPGVADIFTTQTLKEMVPKVFDGIKKDFKLPVVEFMMSLPKGELTRAVGLFRSNQETKKANLHGGLGHGLLCADIGAEFQADNEGNIHRLQEFTHATFRNMRIETRGAFDALYKGFVAEAGQPSLLAQVFEAKKWVGEDSIVETLRNTQPMEFVMERQMVMEMVAGTLASSYNYMKCAHHPKAEKIAVGGEYEDRNPNDRAYGPAKNKYPIKRSFFRPEPDTDPKMLCQVVRQHMAIHRTHEAEMDAWDNVADFAGNRYKLTWETLLAESWTNFKRFKNNPTLSVEEMMSGVVGNGFYMSTCVNDNLKLTNYLQLLTPTHDRWNFPFICGSWRADETRAFLDLINAGPGSDTRNPKGPKKLFTDRLPRSLKHLSPVSNYLTTCEVGVRFPQKGDNGWNFFKHFQVNYKESDKDCNLIKQTTAAMDEYAANEWFCNSNEHTVLKRERDHIDCPSLPHDRIKTHKAMCKSWAKKDISHPSAGEEA